VTASFVWLKKVPVLDLWRLRRACQGSESIVIDGPLYDAIVESIWSHATKKPRPWEQYVCKTGLTALVTCAGATYPNDPKHQIVQYVTQPELEPSTTGLPLGAALDDIADSILWRCLCGYQQTSWHDHTKSWAVGPPFWPILPGGIYLVCPKAKFADDEQHGWTQTVTGLGHLCLCNKYFSDEADESKRGLGVAEGKKLPAY